MRTFLVGIAAAACLAVVGPFAYGFVTGLLNGTASVTTTDERRLGAIATSIARRPVKVECRDWAGWRAVAGQFPDGSLKGFVEVSADGRPDDKTYLAPEVCRALHGSLQPEDFPALSSPAGLRLILAVTALAHESWHLGGVKDEATAQCYGLQSTRYVAIRLGASPKEAQLLAEVAYRSYMTPDAGQYFSPDCIENGRLDLTPGDGRWP